MVDDIIRLAGPYTGAGLTQLTFGFKIFEPTDVYVATAISGELEPDTTLEYGSDYSVTMNSDQDATPGGYITLTNAMVEGQVVVIGSGIPYTQNTQLTNYSRFPPSIINDALDRIVVQIQQIVEKLGRAILVPPTSTVTPMGLLIQIFQAAKSAAEDADDAEAALAACEEIKQHIEVYSWDIPHLVNSIRDVENYPYDGFFVVGGFGNPGHKGQNISNRYVKAEGSTELRTLGERFADIVNVKDFGAKGDGVTDDTAAFIKANGFSTVTVPSGIYRVKSLSITSDIEFLLGAAISVDQGEVVHIQGQVTSPKQYIFRGEGTYNIEGKENDTGEQYRESHCSWWGIFPGSIFSETNADRLSKALSSYGTTKEGIIYFDIGGYHLDKTVDIPRCCEIRGDGTRKTVFVPHSDGWPIFRTSGDGVQFTDIQFETAKNGQQWEILLRESPAIQDDGGHCVITNTIYTNYENAIVINGNSSSVYNACFSIDTKDGDSSSSFLTVTGSYFNCDGLFCNYGQSYSSGSVVKISPQESVAIMRGITIRNVHTIAHGKAVVVDATENSIVGITIDGINYHPIVGSNADSMVSISVGNLKYIQAALLSNWSSNGYPSTILSIDAFSGGKIMQTVASNIVAFGSSASGSGFLVTVPEVDGGEIIDIVIGPTSINRKNLISAPSASNVTIKQVSLTSLS